MATVIGHTAVAVALTIINTMTRGDAAYALVIIWALGGIIVKQIDISAIVYTAGLGIVTITLFLIYKLRT